MLGGETTKSYTLHRLQGEARRGREQLNAPNQGGGREKRRVRAALQGSCEAEMGYISIVVKGRSPPLEEKKHKEATFPRTLSGEVREVPEINKIK